MENSKLENVVDRLEEAYEFDRGEDFLSQLYFSTSYDCGGRGILFGNAVLYSTADDGEYSPCDNSDNTEKESEFCDCQDCETNCREWSEDEIYNKCVARLRVLGETINVESRVVTPVLDLLNERIRFHESISLKSQVADPDARNIIDRDASLRELKILLNEFSKIMYGEHYDPALKEKVDNDTV